MVFYIQPPSPFLLLKIILWLAETGEEHKTTHVKSLIIPVLNNCFK